MGWHRARRNGRRWHPLTTIPAEGANLREWTTREVMDLLAMRRRGLTTYAMARHLGRSEDSVRGAIQRLGATARPRWDGAEVSFLQTHYWVKGCAWCSERLCRSKEAVRAKAARMGMRPSARDREGSGYAD